MDSIFNDSSRSSGDGAYSTVCVVDDDKRVFIGEILAVEVSITRR